MNSVYTKFRTPPPDLISKKQPCRDALLDGNRNRCRGGSRIQVVQAHLTLETHSLVQAHLSLDKALNIPDTTDFGMMSSYMLAYMYIYSRVFQPFEVPSLDEMHFIN